MTTVEADLFRDALKWRCIGPFRGGRVVAVAGDPRDRNVFYFGACAGGVWKTGDAGTYWENVSDGWFGTAAVGAIAVADSDPNVVYVGTGEACLRGDVSHGDGVYRSTDGGQTWTHLGLDDTRHISRIRVHPTNPDVVYVAALGHAFGPNEQRGVFRSTDGGSNWDRVLFESQRAGAIDLSMDPNNPRVLYAAIYQVLRTPWSLTSGGPDTELYRSTDGGDTWVDLTDNPGMPEGTKGRIGVAVSPARAGRVWAIVEAEAGGLLRSDDGGDTWELVSGEAIVRQRPFYHHHIFADPADPETLWVLAIQAWRSTDGGRTFTMRPNPHSDSHDLWIDPRDPQRMIEGNDGGACVSLNGGATWSTIYNQPTAQLYHLATDTRFPYRVYGTQQDNTAISVPSRSEKGAVLWQDCYAVGPSESGYIAVRPDDPNVVYSGAVGSAPGGGGAMLRYDHGTGQVRIITVWPEISYGRGARDMRYRFQWTYPIVISPHDPGVLYAAGNRVFRSTDEGTSWEAVSPDLTRDDPTKGEPGGGPITRDIAGCEHYCTIFSFAESPHEPGVLWAGSDEGLVHLSRDGGASWADMTPRDLPEWTTVTMIEASPHDPATAYLSATRYKLDDYRPMLYRTGDYGRTWTTMSAGLPPGEITRVIREDPVRRGLLFVGTETRVYVSDDDGVSWQPLQVNMPVVPIHDLAVKDGDLVAATHGRSFWVLDDLTPLRQTTGEVLRSPAHLFAPGVVYRTPGSFGAVAAERLGPGKNYNLALGVPAPYRDVRTPTGETKRLMLDAGENPPAGALVTYHLRDGPSGRVTLRFLDASGRPVNSYQSKGDGDDSPSHDSDAAAVTTSAGMNRFVWDMRYPGSGPSAVTDTGRVPGIKGPMVAPGEYRVRLEVEGAAYDQPIEVRLDPRIEASQSDLDAQLALLLRIRDKHTEVLVAVRRLRSVRDQLVTWVERAAGHGSEARIRDAADSIKEELEGVERRLVPVETPGERGQMARPHPQLADALAGLSTVVAGSDAVPTRQAYQVLEDVSGRIDEQIARLTGVVDGQVASFSRMLDQLGVPPVAV